MIWTFGQAAVVAVYAAGIKLAGGYPAPPEATADLGLAVAQLVLAVCFAPLLFADASRGIRTAAIGFAWTTLAALLAGRSLGQTVTVTAVTALWIATFAAWHRYPAVTLALTFLTLAGPVLFYVSLEYGGRPLALGDWPTLLSPPLGATATRLHESPWRPLFPPAALLLTSIVASLTAKKRLATASKK